MDHAVAVGAQHRKVGRNIISDRHAFLQRRDRFEVVGFNKALADRAITFLKIEIANLADCAVEFLSLLHRRTIAFDFAHAVLNGIFPE